MNYSQHTKQAYAFCKNNKIVYRSGELKYTTEAEALAALVASANKDELIERAATILRQIVDHELDKGDREVFCQEWLELAAALEGAEYVIKTDVQAAIDEANNPLPGANADYYEHLAAGQ